MEYRISASARSEFENAVFVSHQALAQEGDYKLHHACEYMGGWRGACLCHAVFSKVEGCGVLCLNNISSLSHALHFLGTFADLSQWLSEQLG